MTWTPMPKIPRLFRECVITEKIDGTNAAIEVTEDGVSAYSKNRDLIPGKATDNFGFAAWVWDNEEALSGLGLGVHRGEWWGVGINRGYGLVERRFSLFNTARWNEEACRAAGLPANVHAVPVLFTGGFVTGWIEAALDRLAADGSQAAPGYMNPEGIVVYHKASGHTYKVTIENDQEAKSAVREW